MNGMYTREVAAKGCRQVWGEKQASFLPQIKSWREGSKGVEREEFACMSNWLSRFVTVAKRGKRENENAKNKIQFPPFLGAFVIVPHNTSAWLLVPDKDILHLLSKI